MNKNKLLLITLLTTLNFSFLFAHQELSIFEENQPQLSPDEEKALFEKDYPNLKMTPGGIILEFRPSYWMPLCKQPGQGPALGGFNTQITGTFPLYYGLNIWAAIDYFSKKGNTTNLNYKTKLQIIPLTLGIKFFFPTLSSKMPTHFYLGSGMKYFFVSSYINSPYVKQTISTSGMGGIVETGLTMTLIKNLILDIFCSYSFKTLNPPLLSKYPAVEPTKMNLNSITLGGGIGYKF